MKLYDYLLQTYSKTTPILVSELEVEGMTKRAIRMGISRLYKEGKIRKASAGVYYLPEISDLLNLEKPILNEDICIRKYISNKDESFGFFTGLYLIHGLGYMTQVPSVYEIVTNKEKKNRRVVTINNSKWILRKPYTEITSDNVDYLQFLDLLRVLQNEDWEEDKDNNYKNLRWFIKNRNLDLEKAKKYIYYYPKKVAKRFMEVESEFARR